MRPRKQGSLPNSTPAYGPHHDLVFQNFLYRYPALSMFTRVYWPKQMPEEARRKMAMEYAERNRKNAKFDRHT